MEVAALHGGGIASRSEPRKWSLKWAPSLGRRRIEISSRRVVADLLRVCGGNGGELFVAAEQAEILKQHAAPLLTLRDLGGNIVETRLGDRTRVRLVLLRELCRSFCCSVFFCSAFRRQLLRVS